jgi:hypothetical protein
MFRVRLVVTGDVETRALGPSLQRALRTVGAVDVEFITPAFKVDGGALTCNPLADPANLALPVPSAARRMANALLTETLVSRRRSEPLPDLVIGVDDLELANAHQPAVVAGWVRRAIREAIERHRYPAQAREALRERCSFHLLVPLVEAYFFGEEAALARAGVGAHVPVHRLGTNVEDFETDDPAFLPLAAAQNAQQAANNYGWWREERHPKRYLSFLVGRSGGLYDETVGGRAALETLDWGAVGADRQAVRFARSLFEDISAALEVANPLGAGATADCTYPSRAVRPETLTLRNL